MSMEMIKEFKAKIEELRNDVLREVSLIKTRFDDDLSLHYQRLRDGGLESEDAYTAALESYRTKIETAREQRFQEMDTLKRAIAHIEGQMAIEEALKICGE